MAKGSKTLNPADKARKEARKKELKKNKKQRQQVRSAAIESKDPEQILADLENLDKLEFDVDRINTPEAQHGSSSDLLFKEKRRRLVELWSKVISYYQREDQDKYSSLKNLEAQYETNHVKLERNYEAVKAAQEATIDDIVLPPEPDPVETLDEEVADDDPLMSESIYITPLTAGAMKPPGCPPGPPPDLKLIVDNLKSSLATPTAYAAQTIPQNLINFGLSRPTKRKFERKPGRGDRPQGDKSTFRANNAHPDKLPNKTKRDQIHVPSTNKTTTSGEPRAQVTKSAVIESKPVIFMPKATKFLPASVRSKIKKPADGK